MFYGQVPKQVFFSSRKLKMLIISRFVFLQRGSGNYRHLEKFFSSIKACDSDTARMLAMEHNLDVNLHDNTTKTALFYSIVNRDEKAVKMLLNLGSAVNTMSYVAYRRDSCLYSCYEPPGLNCFYGFNQFMSCVRLVKLEMEFTLFSQIKKSV